MSKIKIRAGEIEIEYEGEEKLTKQDLVDLITQVSSLLQAVPQNLNAVPTTSEITLPINSTVQNLPQMTTKMIAQKINVKSGTDLAFAASIQLGLLKGNSTFSRKDILSEMQSATSYYNSSMGSNLTKSLNRLTNQGLLNESSEHVFSLTAKAEQEAQSKVA